jgi:hypothetical protein
MADARNASRCGDANAGSSLSDWTSPCGISSSERNPRPAVHLPKSGRPGSNRRRPAWEDERRDRGRAREVVHTTARTWSRTASLSVRYTTRCSTLERSRSPTITRSWCLATSGAAGNGPASFGQRAPLVGPQAGESPVRAEFAAWHRKEVYRGPHRRARGRRVTALVTGYRRLPSLCDRMRRHTATRIPDNSAIALLGVALTAGHTGRDPSFDLGLQPPHRVRGESATGRKLPTHFRLVRPGSGQSGSSVVAETYLRRRYR